MPRIDPEKNRSYFKKWWEANKDTQKMRVRRNQKRFKQEVAALKMHPCLDCGFVPVDACQMDWDHVDGVKVNGVSQLVALGSMSRVLDEISKCELVCANCHRLRTKTRGLEGTV